MDIERIMTARAIGFIVGTVVTAIVLAVRIARDPMARLGLKSIFRRGR